MKVVLTYTLQEAKNALRLQRNSQGDFIYPPDESTVVEIEKDPWASAEIGPQHKITLIKFIKTAIQDWEEGRIIRNADYGNPNHSTACSIGLASAKSYVEAYFNMNK